MSTHDGHQKTFTTPSFAQYKEAQKRIVMCTAADFMQAQIAAAAGVDCILVGDSLGMTTLGYDSTLPVTMDDMLRATAAVVRGAPSSYVIADMPFMSYQHSHAEGMKSAARLISEAGASAVKVEGASFEAVAFIESLVSAGVPVVGHLGLLPQSINQLGSYHTQAKEVDDIVRLMMDTHAVMTAGVYAIVLECVPQEVAAVLGEMHTLPMIGIGSGPACDGEVQVLHDILGLSDYNPRHAKRYLNGAELLGNALEQFVQEARSGNFPTRDQSVSIDESVVEAATPVFIERLIEQVELMDGNVEFLSEDGDINLEPNFDVDPEDGSRFFQGGGRAHLN